MKRFIPCPAVALLAIFACLLMVPTQAAAADAGGLSEDAAKAYLEKKIPGNPGACLVDAMKVQIFGISDLIPGSQTEVFYRFDYTLRCNRGNEAKKGQGVLHAVRLRDGSWMDRETFQTIGK